MKKYLYTPGPTQVPLEVAIEGLYPIMHHRSSGFSKIFDEVCADLKDIFKTKADVLCFSSTGTGVMESVVVNLLAKNEEVLIVRGGKFGNRWVELCETFDANVTVIDIEWGKSINPDQIEKILNKKSNIKHVFLTHCETSTGVLTDIKRISEITRNYNSFIIVDAITTIGAQAFYMDEWKIDVAIAASHKGFMLPPGLACVAISERAKRQIMATNIPRYYFDFRKMLESLKKSTTTYTPAVSLIRSLKKSIEIIKEEGLENTWLRHERLAMATREAVQALGLELFTKENWSNVLTAVKVPETINGIKLIEIMKNKYGVIIAGGQAHLKGKIFRIGHLGFISDFDIIIVISALERALVDLGMNIKIGSGVTRVQEVFTDY